MVDVRSHRIFEEWLDGQPDGIARLLATRAALRAIPILSKLTETLSAKHSAATICLSSFWAASAALCACKWPKRSTYDDYEASYAAATAASAADDLNCIHAADTAYSVALIASNGINRNAAFAAEAIAHASAAIFSFEDREADLTQAHTALQTDVEAILGGRSSTDLITLPLWPETTPKWVKVYWQRLKSHLLEDLKNEDPNWSVWTDWYDALLRGNAPFIEEIEIGDPANGKYGRATFPKDFYQDPPPLNAALRAVIDDYWAEQTAQDSTAEVFGLTDDGRIDVVTQSLGQGLTDTPDQRDWYDALRDSVVAGLDLGKQQLGPAAKPLERLLDGLPENLGDARAARLWPRANRVRRLLAKHEKAEAVEDYSPDRLDSAVAIELEGIVGAYNNLRINDPALIAADENARSPQDVADLAAQNADFAPILSDAVEAGILTLDAADILEDATDTLSEIGVQNDVMGRLGAEHAAKTQRNFLRKAVTVARDGGALYAAGKGAKEICEFVIRNKDKIGELISGLRGLL